MKCNILIDIYLKAHQCPHDFPFAMDGGNTCCKFKTMKNTSNICDGSQIERESPAECCREAQSCTKPGSVCIDNLLADCKLCDIFINYIS